MKLKPTDKWLIDVKAVATPEGWRHPKTNELLKSMKLDVKPKKKTVKPPEPPVVDILPPEPPVTVVSHETTPEPLLPEQTQSEESPIVDAVVVKTETVDEAVETETNTKDTSDTTTSKKPIDKKAK